MTHHWWLIFKRPSFRFWFAFYDLLHNNQLLFSIVFSIHTESGLFRVKHFSILVTNVGLCRWQLWDLDDGLKMSVTNSWYWKCHQNHGESHQHTSSVTNTIKLLPSWCHQNDCHLFCKFFLTRSETFFANRFHVIFNKFFPRWNWFVACITLKTLGTPPFFKGSYHLNFRSFS